MIGYLTMIDDGKEDYKLLAVVDCDPRNDNIQELSDVSTFILDEIKNFFENYKHLQKIDVIVRDYHSKAEALELIEESRRRYREHV